MNPNTTRTLGRSAIGVTQLGQGCASFGSLFHQVSEEEAFAGITAAWDAGIRYFDVAPWYGRGLSELRTGAGLRYRPRDEFILSSKIGRWLKPLERGSHIDLGPWTAPLDFDVVFDYTYDGIMKSYEQSQLRLGLPWYDVGVIHDLDQWHHLPETKVQAYFDQLSTSGWRAIEELKRAGLLRSIGAGINLPQLIRRFLEIIELDFFLVAMEYTLLRQDLLEEMETAVEQGIGFVIGSPFQSGILATGAGGGAKLDYADPEGEALARVRAMEAICARHDVPLAAAALQFPLGHPSVATVIPGARTAAHVERNVAAFRHPIPTDLWAEMKHEGLIRAEAPVPDR